MEIITMAWGEEYVKRAYTLLKSARSKSLSMITVDISGEPSSPQQAKRLKPALLKGFLKRGPVTWLDADSYIHKVPKLLYNDLDCDIAMFSPAEGEYYSGTLYLNPTNTSFEILSMWEAGLAGDDWELDQKVLSEIIKQINPKIYKLPFSYCWVSEMASPSLGDPIIEQYRIGFKKGENIL